MRALLLSLALLPAVAFGWGFDGHKRLASLMQDPMPTNHCLRAWMKARQTIALQDLSCNPDRNRICPGATCDPNEAPRHYLEIDWVNPPTNYPRSYAQVQAQLGTLNASRNGIVPWRVQDQYAALISAFASKNETQILNSVFFFSHYVMDSFSVLHDTKNYDPNGLHSRWESEMLNTAAYINGITTAAVGYYGTAGRADPLNNIFDIILVGQTKSFDLINADVATTSGDGGVHDMPTFYLMVKDLTARRWGDALTLMASFIWSAWVQAGSPVLTGFGTTCSLAAPSSEIILKGFPVPGGFTHPGSNDGGFTTPDAGAGGGSGGGAGGGSGGAAGGGSGGGSATGGGAGGSGGGTGGAGGGSATGGGTGTGGNGGTGGTGGGTSNIGGGSGGSGGGMQTGGGEGGGGEAPAPVGCSCATPGGLFFAALALLLARARRR